MQWSLKYVRALFSRVQTPANHNSKLVLDSLGDVGHVEPANLNATGKQPVFSELVNEYRAMKGDSRSG